MRTMRRVAVAVVASLGLLVSQMATPAPAAESSRQLVINLTAGLNGAVVDQWGLPMTPPGTVVSLILICPNGTILDKKQTRERNDGEWVVSPEFKTEYWPRGIVSRWRIAKGTSQPTGVVAICTARVGATVKSFAASGARAIGRVGGPATARTPLELEMFASVDLCVPLHCEGTDATAIPTWRSTRNFGLQDLVGKDAVAGIYMWGQTGTALRAGKSAEVKQALRIRASL